MKRWPMSFRVFLALLVALPLLTGARGASETSDAWYLHPLASANVRLHALGDLGLARGLAASITPAGYSYSDRVMSISRSLVAQADTPYAAYPGAEGDGAKALTQCDRSTVYVYKITTTSGSGPGSWNAAWDSVALHPSNLKIVISTVAGWVYPGTVTESASCFYFALQTAPGGGLHFSKHGRFFRLTGGSDGVIRGGFFAGQPYTSADVSGDYSTPMISVNKFKRLVMAENLHIWSLEKDIQVGPISSTGTDSVLAMSVQQTMFYQPQDLEPTSVQVSDLDDNLNPNDGVRGVSFGQDVWNSVSHRAPLYAAAGGNHSNKPKVSWESGRLISNLWYNTGNQSAIMLRSGAIEVIDGHMKAGPMTDTTPRDFSWLVSIENASGLTDTTTHLFADSLTGHHNTSLANRGYALWFSDTTSSTAEVAGYYTEFNVNGGGDPRDSAGQGIKVDTAFPAAPVAMTRINPANLVTTLIGATDAGATVGPYHRIQCDGTFTTRSDSALSASYSDARNGTGIGNPSAVDSAYVAPRQAWPVTSGSACADNDGDGMPNAFEVRIQGGTDSTGALDNGDPDGDGFTNIEEYVNGTDPLAFNAEPGSGGGGAPASATYGNGRYVYRTTVIVDTFSFAGGDSQRITLLWNPDSVPLHGGRLPLLKPDSSEILFVQCDSVSTGFPALDSAAADSTRAAYGDTTDLRSVTIAGCGS